MRITGGSLRGRKIRVPAGGVRPTSDKARQAFFNIVAPRIADGAFLDLFSGTGIFSFEAVSRGAARAVAVERSRVQAAAIARAAAELSAPVECITADAVPAIRKLAGGAPFDVVYADPPYDYDGYPELLESVDRELPLATGAVVGIEHRRGRPPFESNVLARLLLRKISTYGNVSIAIFDVPDRE